MKLSRLLLFTALASTAAAGTAELNRNRGLWDFDGSLDSRYFCFGPASTSSPSITLNDPTGSSRYAEHLMNSTPFK